MFTQKETPKKNRKVTEWKETRKTTSISSEASKKYYGQGDFKSKLDAQKIRKSNFDIHIRKKF